MAKKASPAELKYRATQLALLTESITQITCKLLHVGLWLGVMYMVYLSIDTLAGKSTKAELFFKAMTDLKANQAFAYLFGAGGVGYGLLERRSRTKSVARVQARNRELEKSIDPGRSSGGRALRANVQTGD